MADKVEWKDADSRDAKVRAMVLEGKSSGVIGAYFGVTRNAVAGLRNRLGLKGHASIKLATGPKPTKPWVPPRVKAPSTPTMRGRTNKIATARPPLVVVKEPPKPPGCNPVTLMDLERDMCRWPIEGLYCGAPAVAGKSWCAYHKQLGVIAPSGSKPPRRAAWY